MALVHMQEIGTVVGYTPRVGMVVGSRRRDMKEYVKSTVVSN